VTTTAPTPASPARRRALLPLAAAAGLVAIGALALLVALLGADEPEVSVYPTGSTLAAASETAITFRGVDPDELDDVEVTGARSGRHSGRLRPLPGGDGAAFVPDRPFAPGERVTIDAGMRIAGTRGERSSFVVARRSSAKPAPYDQAKPPDDRGVQVFASRPDLRPPAVTVAQASARAEPGSVFVAPKRGATQQGPMILDAAGELVWFQPLPGDEQAFDFRAQTYRGEPVLTWWQGRMQIYRGEGVGRIVDTRYRPVATVRAANGYDMDAHEMKLTPAGTALVMSYFVVPWDLSKLGGRRDGLVEDNVVQEIDVETGAVLFEWHALGSVGLGESYRPAPKERGKIHDPWHLNSVELDRDGDFIVSARHTNAIYKIDRETGRIAWRLGGKRSSFEMGRGAVFKLQHDARVHPDGTLTLFDNVAEDLPANGRRSRGIALDLDHRLKTASLVRDFEHPDGILSGTQGSMQVLDGGGAFVGWGGLHPEFTEFDRDGDTVFDARFRAQGVETYRAYRMPWRAAGAGRPAAVATASGATTTVKASWNGATEVASWRVRPSGAGEETTAPRDGFETSVQVRGRPDSVVVEALDAAGDVLGASEPVPVRRARG
jgi:Arylsulfotransferase (ASST)